MPSHSGRKVPNLTYHQHQVAQQLAQANWVAINRDVDAVLEHLDEEATHLSFKHGHSVAWFQHQFYQGGHMVCQQ